MSPRDLPFVWRGAAVAFAIFASWWLTTTDVALNAVGESIAPIGLGVVAALVLRGMNAPLGIWPAGDARERFVPGWVIGAGAVVGGLVVAANPARSADLVPWLDRGRYALVIAGGLAWGYALAFVRQRRFVPWFGAAALLALVPALLEVGLRRGGETLCWMSGVGPECATGVLQAGAFGLSVVAPSALVTTEIAFRRLVLGRTAGAGMLLVLASALSMAAWYAAVSPEWPPWASLLWWLAAGAAAAALYALSGSLLVSALYVAVLEAGALALHGGAVARAGAGAGWSSAGLIGHGATALALASIVWHRYGWRAGLAVVDEAADDVGVTPPQEAVGATRD